MTNQELRGFISKNWGDNVLTAIDNQQITPMTVEEFIKHCTACGGDWGAMFLTGINKLYPEVYNAIPDDMGHFVWRGICTTLALLGVEF